MLFEFLGMGFAFLLWPCSFRDALLVLYTGGGVLAACTAALGACWVAKSKWRGPGGTGGSALEQLPIELAVMVWLIAGLAYLEAAFLLREV